MTKRTLAGERTHTTSLHKFYRPTLSLRGSRPGPPLVSMHPTAPLSLSALRRSLTVLFDPFPPLRTSSLLPRGGRSETQSSDTSFGD